MSYTPIVEMIEAMAKNIKETYDKASTPLAAAKAAGALNICYEILFEIEGLEKEIK